MSSLRREVFRDADILVPLNPPKSQRRPWDRKVPLPVTNTYIGQLKLLASEIAFLVLGIPPLPSRQHVIVYAGAAGGHHIPALASMYPAIDFYLYDPAPFAIKATKQIHIIQGLFTDEVAKEWGRRGEEELDVIFISDVRTSGDTAEEHESEIAENMAMQARWIDLVRPSWWSLKFRIPYPVIESQEPFFYLRGKLIYQPYPKPVSMELRLIGNRQDAEAGPQEFVYDSQALEQTVFYHNTIVRPNRNRYANVFTGDAKPYDDPQFDNGYDCTYFLHCLKRYLDDGDETTTLALANRLLSETSQGRWTLLQRKTTRPPIYERPRSLKKNAHQAP